MPSNELGQHNGCPREIAPATRAAARREIIAECSDDVARAYRALIDFEQMHLTEFHE